MGSGVWGRGVRGQGVRVGTFLRTMMFSCCTMKGTTTRQFTITLISLNTIYNEGRSRKMLNNCSKAKNGSRMSGGEVI